MGARPVVGEACEGEIEMETVQSIFGGIIRWIPHIIIILIIVRKVDKHPNETTLFLNIIRWIFIGYAFVILFNFALHYDTAFKNEAFQLRVMGPYWWAYWTMMFFSSVCPLILLIKKLGRNQYLLLFISIMMSIGYWFELFVIVMSLHRDYLP